MDPVSAATAWYVYLGSQPGFAEHAWFQVKAFARDYPAVFKDLPDLVKAEIARRKQEQGKPGAAAVSAAQP